MRRTKNNTIVKTKAVSQPNIIDDQAKLNIFADELKTVLYPDYTFEIIIGGIKTHGDCIGDNVASARRLVYTQESGEIQEFNLKICD